MIKTPLDHDLLKQDPRTFILVCSQIQETAPITCSIKLKHVYKQDLVAIIKAAGLGRETMQRRNIVD